MKIGDGKWKLILLVCYNTQSSRRAKWKLNFHDFDYADDDDLWSKTMIILIIDNYVNFDEYDCYPVQPSSQVSSQPMCQRENTATISCKS